MGLNRKRHAYFVFNTDESGTEVAQDWRGPSSPTPTTAGRDFPVQSLAVAESRLALGDELKLMLDRGGKVWESTGHVIKIPNSTGTASGAGGGSRPAA